MTFNEYMEKYNEDELEEIYHDFIEFKKDGVTGNTSLRTSAEGYEMIVKEEYQIKTPTITWLFHVGDYTISYFAKKYFEGKNK